MDIITKEVNSRKDEIEKSLELLFKTNIKITDWDVPEADDRKAAHMILAIFEEKLKNIKKDIDDGQYDNY